MWLGDAALSQHIKDIRVLFVCLETIRWVPLPQCPDSHADGIPGCASVPGRAACRGSALFEVDVRLVDGTILFTAPVILLG